MASAAALKMAAVCMLAMSIGSQMITDVHASPEQDAAAVGALLQDLAEEPGLDADEVGAAVVCTPACQVCLIVCLVQCVLDPKPLKCYSNCIVKQTCLTKTMTA